MEATTDAKTIGRGGIQTDLFGVPVADSQLPRVGARKANAGKPQGYAAPPGTGPRGETCSSCEFAIRQQGGRKYYWKCRMLLRLRVKWTRGYGTDILLKSPACKHWQMYKLSPFKTLTA